MSIILPDGSEQAFLTAYFAVASLGGGHRYRLYTNDVTGGLTPDEVEALTGSDFTEATFTGYAAVVRNGGWTITAGNPTVARNTDVAFTRSSTGTTQAIRGYYVTAEPDLAALAWFEPFLAPINITDAADAITITPTLAVEDSGGNMVPVGLISPYGAASAPDGWLACDGSAVSRTTYASLYAVVADAYGAGDGSTTFNVPDLQQRFPLGLASAGTGSTLGDTGGAIDHVHDLDSATSHARVAMQAITGQEVSMQRKAVASWTSTHGATVSDTIDTNSRATATALGGDTDTANPPFQVVTYIIRAG